MTTCPSTNDARTCTRPDGHDLPHRDDLGTWVHISECAPSEQAHIRALWADEDQMPGQLALDLEGAET